ncbi:hypothetical protein [Phnomibacter ginsenosidimutans]|uniref:RHS repeat protein n=1 Tax=Phnomibacter ginsenosidimutans TaxID=2676868 RepID=A0A6I6H4F3_9BACT|nr:hypothetical protein [Phnomibacter ginsenosidimutans]QGW29301.1 hypothetical protein GLV81_15315 [Phnomibacter ginsenosidimutans]
MWINIVSQVVFAQVANDENAFFDGTYNKAYITKHRIKTVIVEHHNPKLKSSKVIYNFSKEGLLESMNSIDSNGRVNILYRFSFDAYGNLCRIINQMADSKHADTFNARLVYNKNLLVEEKTVYASIPIFHFYDENGLRIKSVNRYYNGWLTTSMRKVDYSYDEHNRPLRITDRIVDSTADTTQQWMSDRLYSYPNKKLIIISEKIANGFFSTNRGQQKIVLDRKGSVIAFESDVAVSRYYLYNRKGLMQQKIEKYPSTFETLSQHLFKTTYGYSFW